MRLGPPSVDSFGRATRLAVTLGLVWMSSGCANELMRTDVIQPVEGKLSFYRTVEVPLPEVAKGIPPISGDLQQRIVNELGIMGKFKRVAPVSNEDNDTLVVQADIRKWDVGSPFLRWWGSVLDLGSNMYEQYAKQSLGEISGAIGDGYLLVDVKLLDKQSQDVLGRLRIKGLSDDPDSPRSAEDRVVHSLVKYLQSRL
jgi:hypothetical protein